MCFLNSIAVSTNVLPAGAPIAQAVPSTPAVGLHRRAWVAGCAGRELIQQKTERPSSYCYWPDCSPWQHPCRWLRPPSTVVETDKLPGKVQDPLLEGAEKRKHCGLHEATEAGGLPGYFSAECIQRGKPTMPISGWSSLWATVNWVYWSRGPDVPRIHPGLERLPGR